MNYILYLDWGALVIYIVILMNFLFKKTIQTRKTDAFFLLLAVSMLSTLFDILSALMLERPQLVPLSLNYLASILYFLIFNITAPIFLQYILTLCNRLSPFRPRRRLAIFLPYLLCAAIIILTPITKGVFYFDDELIYRHGKQLYFLYGVAESYLIGAFWVTLKNRRILSREQRISAYCFMAGTVAAVFIQMLIPKVLITQYASAIAVLLIYMTLQNPADYYDANSESLNRKAFIAVLDEHISSKKAVSAVAVHISDIDHLNRTLGFESVDKIVAVIISEFKEIAGECMFFRLSHTKYAILADAERHIFDFIPERISSMFARPRQIDGLSLSMSASICCISIPETAKTSEEAISMIEYYLEIKAKEGIGTIMWAEADILSGHAREEALLAALREAISSDGFDVVYQPIYSVKQERFTEAEALVRLRSTEELGYVSPEEFIPLAEKNGLIQAIGSMVIHKVCRFLSEEAPLLSHININLSVIQCIQDDLPERLLSVIDEYRLSHEILSFEITETSAACSSDTLRRNMSELIASGIDFYMDDYGSGFSGIGYLVDYPFSVVKLDKHIVWEAFKSDKAMSVLKNTVKMIREMKMRIVAEGVESAEQAEELMAMGCDYLQGYLYARPLNAAALLDFLSYNNNR